MDDFDPFKYTGKTMPLKKHELDPDMNLAKQGDLDAQHRCGVKLMNKNDRVGGLYFLVLASNKGHAETQFTLGDWYQRGQNLPRNPVEAAKYYKLAADQGHAKAQYCLGNMHCDGEGVEKDQKVGLGYIKLAANEGNYSKAQYYLGLRAAGKQSFEKAYRYHRIAAIQGDVEARNALSSAASKRCPEAQFEVASLLLLGKVFMRDQKKAFGYYIASAGQGNANAQFSLASLFENGITERICEGQGCANITTIVPKDEIKALKYYELAADQGHPDALYHLGCIYSDGLFKITEGLCNCGGMSGCYVDHPRVYTVICKKNPEKARLCFQSAADRGHIEARKRL